MPTKEPWQMTSLEYSQEMKRLENRYEQLLQARLKGEIFDPNAPWMRSVSQGIFQKFKKEVGMPNLTYTDMAGMGHKAKVRWALSEGKPVPPEVLKDYPDLAKVTPVTTEVTKPVIFSILEDRLIEALPTLKQPYQTDNWVIAIRDLPNDIQEYLLFEGRKLSLQGQRLLAPVKLKNGMTIRIDTAGTKEGLLPRLLIDEQSVPIPKAEAGSSGQVRQKQVQSKPIPSWRRF